MESCATLLSRDLKSNLFNLFASWGLPFTKPLGIGSYHAGGTNNSVEEGKLQFGALMVRILFVFQISAIIWRSFFLGHVGITLLWAMFRSTLFVRRGHYLSLVGLGKFKIIFCFAFVLKKTISFSFLRC